MYRFLARKWVRAKREAMKMGEASLPTTGEEGSDKMKRLWLRAQRTTTSSKDNNIPSKWRRHALASPSADEEDKKRREERLMFSRFSLVAWRQPTSYLTTKTQEEADSKKAKEQVKEEEEEDEETDKKIRFEKVGLQQLKVLSARWNRELKDILKSLNDGWTPKKEALDELIAALRGSKDRRTKEGDKPQLPSSPRQQLADAEERLTTLPAPTKAQDPILQYMQDRIWTTLTNNYLSVLSMAASEHELAQKGKAIIKSFSTAMRKLKVRVPKQEDTEALQQVKATEAEAKKAKVEGEEGEAEKLVRPLAEWPWPWLGEAKWWERLKASEIRREAWIKLFQVRKKEQAGEDGEGPQLKALRFISAEKMDVVRKLLETFRGEKLREELQKTLGKQRVEAIQRLIYVEALMEITNDMQKLLKRHLHDLQSSQLANAAFLHTLAVGGHFAVHKFQENVDRLTALYAEQEKRRKKKVAGMDVAVHIGTPPTRPLLLIPGIGGSMLKARARKDFLCVEELLHSLAQPDDLDIWFCFYRFESILKQYAFSEFDPTAQYARSADLEREVFAPADFHGLHAIEFLNYLPSFGPTLPYFHVFAQRARNKGYISGETLFGFPYDFRQGTYYAPLLRHLSNRIKTIAEMTNKKLDIVSHSYGGLLLRSCLHRYPETAEYIQNWVTIGTPWHGGSAKTILCSIGGYDFDVSFLSNKAMAAVEITLPITYELMPDPEYKWERPEQQPTITFKLTGREQRTVPAGEEFIEILKTINDGTSKISAPWNPHMHRASHTHRESLRDHFPFQSSGYPFRFFNFYGAGIRTPTGLIYNKEVERLSDLKQHKANFAYADGDFMLDVETARNDGMNAAERRAFKRNHIELIFSRDVFESAFSYLKD